GAKLAKITQVIMYRGIQERQKATPHGSMESNVDSVWVSIKAYTGSEETNETIWESIRKCTIYLHVQQFLYSCPIHNTPMIGEVWFRIEGFQRRGLCTLCGATENMEHILLLCNVGMATDIWGFAKKLWPHENIKWPEINLGTIFGCGCLMAKYEGQANRIVQDKDANLKLRGMMCLLQIMILEAAQLIWVKG
ncbi:hypothetical protein V8E53_013936, partial [Lactarius tabidus]